MVKPSSAATLDGVEPVAQPEPMRRLLGDEPTLVSRAAHILFVGRELRLGGNRKNWIGAIDMEILNRPLYFAGHGAFLDRSSLLPLERRSRAARDRPRA